MVFAPPGPSGPVMGPAGPEIIRDATVTQFMITPNTNGLNSHQVQVRVTMADPNGPVVLTFTDRELPKPIAIGQRVRVVFGLKPEAISTL